MEELADCHYVMDGFHFEALKTSDSGHRNKLPIPYKAGGSREEPGKSDKPHSRNAVSLQGTKAREAGQFLRYVVNNWDGIVRRYTKDIIGSCTEGLVSHVYSEIKQKSYGWSEAGLNKWQNLESTQETVAAFQENFRRPEDEKNRSILKEYGKKRLQMQFMVVGTGVYSKRTIQSGSQYCNTDPDPVLWSATGLVA